MEKKTINLEGLSDEQLDTVEAFAFAVKTQSKEHVKYERISGIWSDSTRDGCFNIGTAYKVEPPTAEDYLKGHRECGKTVGDTVRITGAAKVGEKGWGCPLAAISHTSYIGEVGVINDDDGAGGFRIKIPRCTVSAPHFVLEKIEFRYREWTILEAIGKTVISKSGEIFFITHYDGEWLRCGVAKFSPAGLLLEGTQPNGNKCGEIVEGPTE